MKRITLIFLFAALSYTSFAQRGTRQIDREKLEAARVAFISTRLDLSTEQAQVFWPIFNEFDDQRRETLRELSRLSRDTESLSEDDAKNRIERRFNLQALLIEQEKDFVQKAADVLSYKQILLLNDINKDFTRSLYQRQRRGNNDNL
ncbi:hypothetical protein [Algoriphagus sediminis]|uniref:LTXXQ motif family protein n=1 Tax=Algoriphagus sediminis TaxID=3057113 RepID=A0ABT7YA36_9BACT|nr:hypothetical protein [Algoriphagus sediminis]MDN3203375.1 hypothetical protein [Algoriphagus sediminis]